MAAAANLTGAFAEIARSFESETGIHVVYSFGATGNLSHQIENGAPFDVFAAADTEHVDELERKGYLTPGTRALYARGRLALWIPPTTRTEVNRLEDLLKPDIRFLAIANPKTAPYGRATVEVLNSVGLWSALQAKIVFAENIRMAKQYAQTGNADASFTAYSEVLREKGRLIEIAEKLHRPIDQAMGIVRASRKQDDARRFVNYVLGIKGQRTLAAYGYMRPKEPTQRPPGH